ncbi:MBL fold metallo-hydrolase, partial [Pseudomonas syringae group genomosp. 7]
PPTTPADRHCPGPPPPPPPTSASALVDYVRAERLQVQWLLETHAHADHLSAAPWLQEQVGGALAIGEHITTVQETFGKVFN